MSAMIYFIQSPETGLVKIGFSLELNRRLYELRRSYREHLVVLGRLVGGKQIEAMLHRMFWNRYVGHEWFLPNDEMETFLVQTAPVPHIPSPALVGESQLVRQWPWYSHNVRRVLRNEPYKRGFFNDPDPLPLPCCPMLEPARALPFHAFAPTCQP